MQYNEIACRWESLGSPVRLVSVQSAVFRQTDRGPSLLLVQRGLPATLVALAPPDFSPAALHPLPEAEGAENLLLSASGELFIPTHPNGRLYRYRPVDNRLTEIPTGLSGIGFIWDLAEDDAGRIYGACWPGARLFAYDPATGTTTDFGGVAPGEQYIRSIAWSAFTHRLYLGIGAHAHLLEFDPRTGTARDILPAERHNQHFVGRLAAVGRWLFASLVPAGLTLVIDLACKGECIRQIGPLDCRSIAAHPSQPDTFLLTAGGDLLAFNPATGCRHVIACDIGNGARAVTVDAPPATEAHALIVTSRGRLIRQSLASETHEARCLDLVPQPLVLQNVASGPDGRIYTSGYVSGGVGIYDPATGARDFFTGVGQAESIAHDGHTIFFGTYPRAVVVAYDPTAPRSADNPRELICLASWGQDRPYSLLADPRRKKLFIGTVPAYGCLGGALAVYDFDRGEARVYCNLIADHSIVSLASDGRTLYGGTSISGGLGVDPRATSAVLFAFDPEKERLLFHVTPHEGARGITGLVCDSRGHLFGWAEGTLFEFDPAQRSVLWRETIVAQTYPATHYWRGIPMKPSLTERDVFYGAAWGRLFRFDATQRRFTTLARIEGAEVVAAGADGNLYAIARSELLRIDLSPVRSTGAPS